MLPGVDGLTLLKRLRSEGRPAHVLILTAKDTVADRVRGLDLGADDYLVKPFAFEELLARVRALARLLRGRKKPARRPSRRRASRPNFVRTVVRFDVFFMTRGGDPGHGLAAPLAARRVARTRFIATTL